MDNAKPIAAIDLRDGTTLPLRKDEDETPDPMSALAELHSDEFKALADAAISNPYIKETMGRLTSQSKELFERVAANLWESMNPLAANLAELVPVEFTENEKRIDHNFQVLRDAGYSEDELERVAWTLFIDREWVAQQLQSKAGYCPISGNLTNQIRDNTPRNQPVRGQSVRVTALLSGLTGYRVRALVDGTQPVTVDDAVQLAIAYGITPAELLGFMDADEVRLIDLWRGLDSDARGHILGLMESLARGRT